MIANSSYCIHKADFSPLIYSAISHNILVPWRGESLFNSSIHGYVSILDLQFTTKYILNKFRCHSNAIIFEKVFFH